MENTKRLVQVFKANNYSLTSQREKILKFLLTKDDHMTIQDICTELDDPNVSQATIYRNLKLFLQLGLVNRVNMNSADYYEMSDQEASSHFHLTCKKCNKIIEIKDISSKSIEELIEERFGFKVTKTDIVFKGICSECKKKEEDNV
ncbi:MAG TPA: Fur family transcriptional regulator [Clostridia bacterium]|nr:Fur family transcriptional regulator [Clostridia bacterium]